eukprot:scaffold4840_cov275-Pinguiococcus_pyrenoidosus.AAC.2
MRRRLRRRLRRVPVLVLLRITVGHDVTVVKPTWPLLPAARIAGSAVEAGQQFSIPLVLPLLYPHLLAPYLLRLGRDGVVEDQAHEAQEVLDEKANGHHISAHPLPQDGIGLFDVSGFRGEEARQIRDNLLRREAHEKAVRDHARRGDGLQEIQPSADAGRASRRGPAVDEADLVQVGLGLDDVAEQRHQGTQREGRREQGDVPELNHHLQEVVEALVLGQIQVQGRQAIRFLPLSVTVVLSFLLLARLAKANLLGHRVQAGRQDGLKQDPSNLIRAVQRDQFTPERGDVELREGEVEQGNVAVEGLEEEALQDHGIVMVVLRAVVLPGGQHFRDLAIQVVQQQDDGSMQDRGHERDDQARLRPKDTPFLRKAGEIRDVERPLRPVAILDVPLKVQTADHDAEGDHEADRRHQDADAVLSQPLRVGAWGCLGILGRLVGAKAPGVAQVVRAPLPAPDEDDAPQHDEDGVEGHAPVLVESDATHVPAHRQARADCRGDAEPGREMVQPLEVEAQAMAEVLHDGVGELGMHMHVRPVDPGRRPPNRRGRPGAHGNHRLELLTAAARTRWQSKESGGSRTRRGLAHGNDVLPEHQEVGHAPPNRVQDEQCLLRLGEESVVCVARTVSHCFGALPQHRQSARTTNLSCSASKFLKDAALDTENLDMVPSGHARCHDRQAFK